MPIENQLGDNYPESKGDQIRRTIFRYSPRLIVGLLVGAFIGVSCVSILAIEENRIKYLVETRQWDSYAADPITTLDGIHRVTENSLITILALSGTVGLLGIASKKFRWF